MFNYQTYSFTTKGTSHLKNEDRFCVKQTGQLLWAGVFDGVSTGGGGDIAAQAAADAMSEIICPTNSIDSVKSTGLEIIAKAQEAILSMQRHYPHFTGLKTTASIVCVDTKQGLLYCFNLGDSAVFLNRSGKHIEKKTSDDTVLGDLLAHKRITAKDAKKVPDRVRHELTKYLGMEVSSEEIKRIVSFERIGLNSSDSIILCTDGLWGFTPEKAMRKSCDQTDDPAVALAKLSREQYKSNDDTTVIVIRPEQSPVRNTVRVLSVAFGIFLFAAGFLSGVFCSVYMKGIEENPRHKSCESSGNGSDTTVISLIINSTSNENDN